METGESREPFEESKNPDTGIAVIWRSIFYFLLLPGGVVLALKWLLNL